MKKVYYIIPIVMLFLSTAVFSQSKRTKMSRDKIKAYKIAYITEKLNLTEKEAKDFWPLYNDYHSRTNEFIKERLQKIKKEISKTGSVDNLSEQQASTLMKINLHLEKKKYEYSEAYITNLQKIISDKKILKLQIAEREFRRHMFEKFRKKRGKKKP